MSLSDVYDLKKSLSAVKEEPQQFLFIEGKNKTDRLVVTKTAVPRQVALTALGKQIAALRGRVDGDEELDAAGKGAQKQVLTEAERKLHDATVGARHEDPAYQKAQDAAADKAKAPAAGHAGHPTLA